MAFVAAVGGGGLASCTSLEPVRPPAYDAYVVGESVDAGAAAASGPQIPCRFEVALTETDDPSAGQLKVMLARADARRRTLVCLSAITTNSRATYDVLMWPLVAGIAADQLAGAPLKNAIYPSALAFAAYQIASSGVPDRDQRYLNTAMRIACAIHRQGSFLFSAAEMAETPANGAARNDFASLRSRVEAGMEASLRGRTALLRSLTPRAGKAAPKPVDFVQRTIAANGGGESSTEPKDRRQLVENAVDQLLRQAQDALRHADLKRRQVLGARDATWREWMALEHELQQQLASRQPAPTSPVLASSAASAALHNIAVAQGGQDILTLTSLKALDGLGKPDKRKDSTSGLEHRESKWKRQTREAQTAENGAILRETTEEYRGPPEVDADDDDPLTVYDRRHFIPLSLAVMKLENWLAAQDEREQRARLETEKCPSPLGDTVLVSKKPVNDAPNPAPPASPPAPAPVPSTAPLPAAAARSATPATPDVARSPSS